MPSSHRRAPRTSAWTGAAAHPRGLRFCVAALAGAVAGSLPLLVSAPQRAAAAPSPSTDLIELGVMPHAVEDGNGDPAPLIVDKLRNLGFAVGHELAPGPNGVRDERLVIHDLARTDRGAVAMYPEGDPPPNRFVHTGGDIFNFALDEQTATLIAPKGVNLTTDPCDPVVGLDVDLYRYAPAGEGWSISPESVFMPCSGTQRFFAVSGAVYEVGEPQHRVRKVLMAGSYAIEGWRGTGFKDFGFQNNLGQPLIIRQLDLDKLYASTERADPAALDWEIDLRYSGCGRWDGQTVLLQRVRDDLVTYCWDTRPVAKSLGAQGYVVRIPLGADHKPETVQGAPILPDPANPTSLAPAAPSFTLPPPPDTNLTPLVLCILARDPICAANDLVRRVPQPALPEIEPPEIDPNRPPDTASNSKFIANPVVRRTPALPGTVFPFADPMSGRILLLTADSVNGNAVWVFDPDAERFIGLVTGGAVNQPVQKTAGGVDVERGRAYLLTKTGVLAASVRRTPLPGGKVHAVIDDADQFTQWRTMAVAPGVHRIFVPMRKLAATDGYAVVQDDTADPPVVEEDDPDTRTRQIAEQPGRTEVDRSGAGQATGAHVVFVGGVPRIVNQLDPLCESPNLPIDELENIERQRFNGTCLADQLISRGNRQFFLGYTDLDTGTSTGSNAEASGLFIPLTDRPTDEDIREVGRCGAGTSSRLIPKEMAEDPGFQQGFGQFQGGYGQFCGGLQDGATRVLGDDLRNGTRGGTATQTGAGFPVPSALCNDFGGKPASEAKPTGVKNAAFSAKVACNADQTAVTGKAIAAGIALPGPSEPLVTLGRVWSDIQSRPSAEGQVTVSKAVAQNVLVGPLSIAEIRTTATTKAKGRTGTARVAFERQWCGVSLAGQQVVEHCVDPTSDEIRNLVDNLNVTLGKVRLSVPPVKSEGTPGGYQAVVEKDPAEVAADLSVNDDDSLTVAGLQVIVYNDGEEGRNRLVARLAAVQAESRYAVVLLPNFDIPFFPELDLDDDPVVEALALASEPRFEEFPAVPASFGEPADNPLAQFFNAPLEALRDLLGWIMQNPREAALLFLFFSILATPVYLILRRRAFERAMAA